MQESLPAKSPGRWRLRWTIIQYELHNIARHPYHLVSFAIPIFMSLVFGLFTAAIRDADTLTVVVYDAGDSAWVEHLAAWPEVAVERVTSETAVYEALDDEATGGLILPVDFDTAVAAGQTPTIVATINADARASNIATFERLLSEEVWALAPTPAPARIDWQERNTADAFPLLDNESYIVVIFLLLGITMFPIGVLPQIILEKRENGTLPPLLASPLSLVDLLLGLATAVCLLTLLLAAILMVINRGWVGNVGITLLAATLTTSFLIGVGLFFGLWAHSKNQCNAYAGTLAIILNMPGWFGLVPAENLAPVVNFVLRLLPTTYFVNTLTYSLSGTATWANVGLNLLLIAGFTAAMLGLVWWWLRRRPLRLAAEA